MYLSFNILLIGGEVSSVTAKMGRGVYADKLAGRGQEPPLRTRMWRGVKGLFFHQHPLPAAPEPNREPASLEQHRAGTRRYLRHTDDPGEEQHQ